MLIEDILRLIAMIVGSVSITLSCVVVGLYFWRWRIAHGGLLFAHVWGIAISHLGYVLISVVVLFLRLGEKLTWLTPAYIVCGLLGGWAMYQLTRYELQFVQKRTKQEAKTNS